VTPNVVEGLSAEPEADSTATDGRFVRHWQIAPAATLAADSDPTIADLPGPTAAWQAMAAERGGLINISRRYGKPVSRPTRNLTWLKTTITSDAKRTRKAAIGWTREVWVYVNGRLAYANKNVYDSASERKQTDGRLALDNGSLVLPFEAGDNQVAVAIASDFYGWGVMLRLDDLGGVKLANP
jgi:hypothetical protein